MTKLTFDWKRIKDEDYCKWYTETREANREECRKVVELKYGKLMKKAKNPYEPVDTRLLNKLIRRRCEKYGFKDACMSDETFEIEIF